MQHTDLLKSLEDPNTYLVSASGDPLQQSLSGLLLDGLPPSASAAFLPKAGQPPIAGHALPVYAIRHCWAESSLSSFSGARQVCPILQVCVWGIMIKHQVTGCGSSHHVQH